MRILITGANAPGTAGTAWSLLRPGLFGEKPELFGSDANPGNPSRYLSEIVQIPHGNENTYIEKLLQICHAKNIDLVVPQTTAETISISRALDQVENKVPVAILKPSEKMSKLISKVETFGLISGSTFCLQNFEICYSREDLQNYITATNSSNFFLKANSLSGGRGVVSVVSSFSDLLLAKPGSFHSITMEDADKAFDSLNAGEGVVVQKSVHGVEYSIDCYRDQSIHIAIPRRRDRIRSGISHETTVVKNQKLIDFAMSFGDALNLEGVFGIQCIETDVGDISFLECNPRIQGTMVASTFANENLIGRGARLALGLESERVQQVKWGTKYSRSSGGMGFLDGKFTEI
jgi:carbamoyl-phosphate synthase large subunit